MHRALSIAELRYLICTRATDHTLVQLAQCCKIFHEPAIRVLWNTIPDLSLLVLCFPQDAWTMVHSYAGDSIKLVRPLAPEDWTAFLKYSNLVRQLGISPFSTPSKPLAARTPRLEQRVLLELSAYRPVFVLFPNLTTFDWAGIRFPEENLPLVLAFLNPNVARVHIRISEEHHDQRTLRASLSLIANRYTSLKEFQLTLRPPQSRDDLLIMPSILPVLTNLTALEVFRCFYIPLTEDVFGALASLQNLTMLAIRLPQTVAWSTIDIRPDSTATRLSGHGTSPKVATVQYIKFSKVSFPHVKAVRIILTDVPTGDDLPRVFTSICAQFSPSVLTKLIVNMDSETPQNRRQLTQPTTAIRLEHLQPLFKFGKFSVFEFSMASRYALDGATYLAVAKAWPHIKTFEIGLGQYCIHSEIPEMRDVLVPFAVHCPKLTRLGVRFDGTKTKLLASGGITHAHAQGRPSTSIVASLNCFDSCISGTTHVAAFLALIFPKLKELAWKKAPAGMMTLSGGLWEEVQQYLPLFAAIREDERIRVGRNMVSLISSCRVRGIMNRALSIAEIRYLICTFATDHTLVRLAQCCKDFHEPAIRVLWNAIPNLSPLVRCFPRDAWTTGTPGRSIKLTRPLAPEDWTAFLKYSNLVRRLGAPSFDIQTPTLQERVMWELSAYRPVFTLFPNLVAFEWTGGVQSLEEELPVVLGFLNSDITKIRISKWQHDQGPLRTSLSLIADRFTHLKVFQLVMRPPRPRDDLLIMPSVLSLVRNPTTLEVFELTHIPLAEDVFNALANRQNLTQLAIRLPESLAWSTIDIRDDHFPMLQDLTIFSRPQDYIDFSSKASFPRVKIVQIRLADVPTQQNDLPRIFASICTQFLASILKTLIIVMEENPQNHRQFTQARTVVRLEDLQLFFKFEKLSVFTFSTTSPYALDPAAYLAMTKAWPHLESFEVGLGEFCVHSDLPEIRDVLVPFAVHCPKLKRLGVRFDGSKARLDTSFAITKALPPGEPSTSVVDSLDCFDSPVAGTPHVAAFLALLFPKLRLVLWKKSLVHSTQPGRSWDEVQQYLPLFAIVREDGRREAAKELQRS
ncbi:hypothetical protein LXA43DRAFT_891462 [Ganoderma leucocontextum]|nr:hypothetical protein LXA43DRAFT_891462 [Ganoderma leucocontextum]